MLLLLPLGLLLAFAIARDGAVLAFDANLCYAGIGMAALAASWQRAKNFPTRWILLLAAPVALALLQTIPLPLAVLSILSPARARSLEGLAGFASLSVTPAATLQMAVRLAAAGLLFLLVREVVRRRAMNPWIAAAPLVVLGLLEGILGLAQQAAGAAKDGATGSYVNRNHFAGLLEMCLPLAVGAAIHHTRKLAVCWGAAAASLVMLAALFGSLSRAGLAAASVGLVALAWLELPAKHRRYVLVPIGLLLAAFLVLAPARMGERLTGGDLSFAARLDIWRETLTLIAHYPLFGCGLGGFESGVQLYRAALPDFRVDFAHNDYLQILAEAGLAGGIAAGAFLLTGIRTAVQALPFPTGRAAACSGLALLVHGLADFNLYIPANLLTFAWVAGITAGLVRTSKATAGAS